MYQAFLDFDADESAEAAVFWGEGQAFCGGAAHIQDKPCDLHIEHAVLAKPCRKCGYHFPVVPETCDSTAVFSDVLELVTPL